MTQTELTPTASLSGKWKPYPDYKDSGVEWLGKIPVHWEVKRLKFFTHTNMGQSPDSNDYNLNNLGIPFLQGNAEFGHIHPEPRIWCETARKFANPIDILLSVRAPVGQMNIADQIYGIGRGLCAITGQRQIDRNYLWFLLQVIREELACISTGSTYDAVSVNEVKRLVGLVPPLTKQRSIATFLYQETARINALIAKKERLIKLLLEKRAALISHAVTKGLDPTVPMKDSGVEWLGEIPAHWEVKRLKFVADVLTGVAKGRDLGQKDVVELPYLRVANVQDGYLDLADIATIIVGVDEVERYSLKYGDVLMNEGGDFDKLGRGYVWEETIVPCLHQNHVFAVRPHFGANPYWISIITLTSYAKHYFILRSKQSTNLASISGTNLKELPVLMPPEDELNEILLYSKDATAKIDALISRIREGIEKLKEYSTALISAAVTGKIDVRGEISMQGSEM
jgi:type I restriction enzyme S subunit